MIFFLLFFQAIPSSTLLQSFRYYVITFIYIYYLVKCLDLHYVGVLDWMIPRTWFCYIWR